VPEPPVLLEVRRGDVVESRHRGSIVLLEADGSVAVSAGAVDAPLLPRSSLKPFQAIAMCEAGFAGDTAALALAAASHDGEQVHREGVRAILAGAGLDESSLGCPADLPGGRAALQEWIAAGGAPSRICHNCSGKHAAMVATCVARDWDVATYLEPQHPLQAAVLETVQDICRDRVTTSTVDGCGAPAHAITLAGLARGFASFGGAPDGTSAARVRDAMTAYPHLVGGTGRAVTELMAGVPGLICKDGAEAVWGAALPDGRAFAAKADDGGARVLGPLLAAALRFWGIDAPAVAQWSSTPLLGGGAPVGAISWSPELRDLLGID
jgi:L-asparaginase II